MSRKIRYGMVGGERGAFIDTAHRIATASTTSACRGNASKKRIFVCYSHKDEKWLTRFKTMMVPLLRNGSFIIWDDMRIAAGQDWRKEIREALASADLAVLLVSPDFLASRFIHEKELPPLLEAADKESLTIFWILLRSCHYEVTEVAKYQAANTPDRPLAKLRLADQDQALVSICKKLEDTLKSESSASRRAA